MIGQTLGHYRIVEKIGAGGMGEVYRAHDERLDRDVALKVLPAGALANEAARKRFRKEALALSKLNHPNIETVYDFDTQEGVDFLVMEHIAGVTLDDTLAAGALPEKEVGRLGAQLAEGLAAAHAEGVVHRDLKPGNLRVTPDGRLKILDFGIAKLIRPVSETATTESFTETQAMAGTLPYMAPEQLRGEPTDARSDLYAAGVVLYEMATGQRPFPATLPTALADDILHKPPPPPGRLNPELSTRLEEIILKCLEKEPEHRYQSARELLVDFRRLGAPTAVPIAPSPQAPAWGRFGQRALPLAGIVVLTLAAVLFVWNVGGLREQLFGGPPRIESLAVLPLKNLMGAPEQDYFVEGMHEALITELSKVGALRVISRTSVMQYKGVKKPLPEIAEELNVEAVVEGSVLRSGDRVRITAQLVGAVPERHLWAENYDRELRDILALSSEVARAIANEIKITVTPEEETRLASARRVNPAAHEAYLKGRYFWNKATIEGVKKGLAYFEQAIEIDPGYALAYVGVADSYALGGGGFFGLRPEEGCARAKAAATKALELDATLAEPHTTLAYCLFFYDWDWLNAEREFKQAIELNPNYAKAHEWYGQYLTAMGRHEEAIAEAKRAQELDPLSLIINTSVGWTFYFARQYDQAIEQYRKTLEMDPNFVETRFGLRYAYLRKGMYDEAIAEWQREMKLLGRPEEKVAALGDTYAESGMRGVWQWRLENLKQAAKRRYVNPFLLAEIYTLLGEKDRAFEWLEKAYEEHAGFMYEFKEDPTFDPLRSDPRFQALLRRMRFPQD